MEMLPGLMNSWLYLFVVMTACHQGNNEGRCKKIIMVRFLLGSEFTCSQFLNQLLMITTQRAVSTIYSMEIILLLSLLKVNK